ncbi:MAG: protein kinase [Planctomycetes bacterium]|nr:protein kinase [Planctomycetota bacterium]
MNSKADHRAPDVKTIFLEALDRRAGEQRKSYLDEACGSNTELRAEVEALLLAHEKAGEFLDPAAFGAGLGPDQSPLTEGPGTVIGRYKLLEKIGEGGMAVVYLAEQTEPIRRRVALKIIKLGMDTRQVIARFEAERQALALMDHPSIARVFDAGATETGRPYFVMELVQGVSITEYCDKNSLSTKDRLALFLQVCHAVQHAHQKGIIHRDIKPSNVMVTHHDGKPVPKVIDFGIAKATNQKLTEKTLFTRYAHLIGTPAYMSPEQAELSDLDIDTRSDIYSLGVLLYELLTGTTPFTEEELRKAGYLEMQRVIREQEPVKPSTRIRTAARKPQSVGAGPRACPALGGHGGPPLREVRGDLDWIVMKSLEKDRVRRYETASGLAEDIRRHLAHEPVLARGPHAAYRLRKFLRRRRAQVLAVLATAVVAGAGITLLSLWNRDRLQLAQAEGFRHQGVLFQAREQYARADRRAVLETIQPFLQSKYIGPEARLLYAGILVEDRRPQEAVPLLADLVKERPEIAGAAHSLWARILWERQSPGAENVQEIEEHRRQAEALLPETATAEAYFLRAMTAVTVQEQLAGLHKALQLDPDHYEAHRLRAFTYQASRKYEKMKDDALIMTVLRRRDPLGYSLRAIALRELGKYADAVAEYDNALALTPKDDPQRLNLAAQRSETLLRVGDYERILAEGPKWRNLWPDRPVFPYHLFCALTARGEYERANALFHEIVRSAPTARIEVALWMANYVFDTLEAGRSWHAAARAPAGAAFLPLVEAEDTYRDLSPKARRIATNGFNGQWSPDGKKLAFSLGVRGYSGVAVYDPATKETELLIVPGKDPKWSPDGKHIAFVRDRRALRLEEMISTERKDWINWAKDDEVWIINPDGTEPRRLARGGSPSWGKDSRCLYYHSRLDNTLRLISLEDRDTEPQQVLECTDILPAVSPDNRYVAYVEGSSLKVKELASGALVIEWPAPFNTWGGPAWSPAGTELCLSGFGDRMGLWIYSLDRSEPARVLGGRTTSAGWSGNPTRLVFSLAGHAEIWAAEFAPNVSAIETLGPGQTLEAYFRDMVAFYTRRIEADSQDAYAYAGRARCYEALHDRANADADMQQWLTITGRQPSPVMPADPGANQPLNLGLPVNSPFTDFGPVLAPDGLELYFASNRPGGHGDMDIWVAKRATMQDPWGQPENLGPPINTTTFEYPGSLSADGLTLYVEGGYSGYGLHRTTRSTKHAPWGPPVSLGPSFNSLGTLVVLPVISADGLELYFSVFNAHADIWMSTRATGSDPWGTPKPLDPPLNSPAQDWLPWISPDGLTAVIWSNRPGGMGSIDTWVTTRVAKGGVWGPPRNLGPLFNTKYSDLLTSISPDGRWGYFSDYPGARPGGFGGSDLWRIFMEGILDVHAGGKIKGKEDGR